MKLPYALRKMAMCERIANELRDDLKSDKLSKSDKRELVKILEETIEDFKYWQAIKESEE